MRGPKRLLPCLWMLLPLLACGDPSTSPAPAPPPESIDRLLIYARNWPTEEVEFALTRSDAGSTVVLFRPARDGNPRLVLDSIGPVAEDVADVRTMLATFDVWALNAANAPGAACRTVNGQRSCNITWEDYSVVMLVEVDGVVRVQRYTGLESPTPARQPARALGDYVLAWARRLDTGT